MDWALLFTAVRWATVCLGLLGFTLVWVNLVNRWEWLTWPARHLHVGAALVSFATAVGCSLDAIVGPPADVRHLLWAFAALWVTGAGVSAVRDERRQRVLHHPTVYLARRKA